MYQIESVFIGDHRLDEPQFKSEIQPEIGNSFKVGDVIRIGTNNFAINCLECSKTFPHFAEFTLHIEEHFAQEDDEIKDIKSELFDDELENSHDGIDCMEITESVTKSEACILEKFEPSLDLTEFIEGVAYKKSQSDYECMICGFRTTLKYNLKAHVATHVKVKNIFCPICIKGFNSIYYVQRHLKTIHKQPLSAREIRKAQLEVKQIVKTKKSQTPDEKLKLNLLSSSYWRMEGKRYHCTMCVSWFSVPKYVQKHIRLVHGQNCPLDDILAAQIGVEDEPEPSQSTQRITQIQMDSLQREQAEDRTKIKIKSFECFACHRMFVSEKALRCHMPLHEGMQFGCPLCEKFFHMKKYVRDHLIYRHGFDKKSKLPPLKTRIIDNFEYHKPQVSRYECYLCCRTYPSRSKLNSHFKSHLDVLECSICMKIFKSTESRRRHMQLHNSQVKHECSQCNKKFTVKRYLMSHMRTKHTAPSLKQQTRYICDHCGENFENRRFLSRHRSSAHKMNKKFARKRSGVHSREKVQCEICGNQFATESQLNAHKKRVHMDGPRHKCDVCAEEFDQSKKLLLHRRSHTESMDIICNDCHLGFLSLRSLAKHKCKCIKYE